MRSACDSVHGCFFFWLVLFFSAGVARTAGRLESPSRRGQRGRPMEAENSFGRTARQAGQHAGTSGGSGATWEEDLLLTAEDAGRRGLIAVE